jgi:hypothetical protein
MLFRHASGFLPHCMTYAPNLQSTQYGLETLFLGYGRLAFVVDCPVHLSS